MSSMVTPGLFGWIVVGAAAVSVFGCAVDDAPAGLRRTPAGDGALVRFDMFHKPLPEIPLPNNLATWPDPTSRTGLRINASLLAGTDIEFNSRRKMDEIEGWATFGPITVAFDMPDKEPGEAALDLDNVRRRHQGDDYDPGDDAVYLVNLRTGIPVPLDIGEGSFDYTLRDKREYWPNDPRRSEQLLMFETYDEAPGMPATTPYRPALDTDFDGVLDRPNLDHPAACPPPPANLDDSDAAQAPRDRCLADHALTWYERETDTLLAAPLIPLEEMTEYAVVVTDRLRDSRGRPVRSPLDFVYHPMQERGIATLRDVLAEPSLQPYYGDIAGSGLEHVAFAWTFTTQPVYDDMKRLRDGLYGQGPFAWLSGAFPPELKLERAVGRFDSEELAQGADDTAFRSDAACQGKAENLSIVRYEDLKDDMSSLLSSLGFGGGVGDEIMASFDRNVAYIAVGNFQSPFLLQDGPQGTDPGASFRVNFTTGEGEVHADRVSFVVVVPKATDKIQPPFPVALYTHGSGNMALESVLFAGNLARHGFATIAIDAVGHGLAVHWSQELFLRSVLKGNCLAPAGDALLQGRARDLDGDGVGDSGGDLWTAYFFHTRDVLRQTVLDQVQLIRILESFDGKRLGQDYDGDGAPNVAGDFDNDGVVDIGGPDARYVVWGSSFGGIVASVLGAVHHHVVATGSNAGGGGLVNIGVRSNESQVVNAISLGLMGPLIVGRRAQDDDPPVQTNCAADQITIRWVVPDLDRSAEIEIGCVDADAFGPDGGTVLVRNETNAEVRCARVDGAGRFRVPLPASRGDHVSIELYSVPDNVVSYKGCSVVDPAALSARISTWQSAFWQHGDVDRDGHDLCPHPQGCMRFHGVAYGVGTPLVSPVEGFGYIRQTPSFRRLVTLGQTAVNGADPINFAPYYGLKTILDPWGQVAPTHAFYEMPTAGDSTVPTYSGLSLARAAGVIPFLRPDAAAEQPAWADYATPAPLYDALGGATPNRLLIDKHVIEGVYRLARSPADQTCGPNEQPLSVTACHAACKSSDDCRFEQDCVDGICQRTMSTQQCMEAVFDPDVLDEGQSHYGQQRAPVPLRLARVARPVAHSTLEQVWAPRLLGVPYASSDEHAWHASEPTSAVATVYMVPWGQHLFNVTDRCRSFDMGRYMINTLGHWFATDGRDLYYLSHPSTHRCQQDDSCPYMK